MDINAHNHKKASFSNLYEQIHSLKLNQNNLRLLNSNEKNKDINTERIINKHIKFPSNIQQSTSPSEKEIINTKFVNFDKHTNSNSNEKRLHKKIIKINSSQNVNIINNDFFSQKPRSFMPKNKENIIKDAQYKKNNNNIYADDDKEDINEDDNDDGYIIHKKKGSNGINKNNAYFKLNYRNKNRSVLPQNFTSNSIYNRVEVEKSNKINHKINQKQSLFLHLKKVYKNNENSSSNTSSFMKNRNDSSNIKNDTIASFDNNENNITDKHNPNLERHLKALSGLNNKMSNVKKLPLNSKNKSVFKHCSSSYRASRAKDSEIEKRSNSNNLYISNSNYSSNSLNDIITIASPKKENNNNDVNNSINKNNPNLFQIGSCRTEKCFNSKNNPLHTNTPKLDRSPKIRAKRKYSTIINNHQKPRKSLCKISSSFLNRLKEDMQNNNAVKVSSNKNNNIIKDTDNKTLCSMVGNLYGENLFHIKKIKSINANMMTKEKFKINYKFLEKNMKYFLSLDKQTKIEKNILSQKEKEFEDIEIFIMKILNKVIKQSNKKKVTIKENNCEKDINTKDKLSIFIKQRKKLFSRNFSFSDYVFINNINHEFSNIDKNGIRKYQIKLQYPKINTLVILNSFSLNYINKIYYDTITYDYILKIFVTKKLDINKISKSSFLVPSKKLEKSETVHFSDKKYYQNKIHERSERVRLTELSKEKNIKFALINIRNNIRVIAKAIIQNKNSQHFIFTKFLVSDLTFNLYDKINNDFNKKLIQNRYNVKKGSQKRSSCIRNSLRRASTVMNSSENIYIKLKGFAKNITEEKGIINIKSSKTKKEFKEKDGLNINFYNRKYVSPKPLNKKIKTFSISNKKKLKYLIKEKNISKNMIIRKNKSEIKEKEQVDEIKNMKHAHFLRQVSNMTKESSLFRTYEIKRNMMMNFNNLVDKAFYLLKENNYEQFIDLFERYKADIEAKDSNGNTYLIVASECGHFEFAKYLIKKGANVNVQNNKLNTALHRAIATQHFDIVDILINAGASEDLANDENLTPWQCLHKF